MPYSSRVNVERRAVAPEPPPWPGDNEARVQELQEAAREAASHNLGRDSELRTAAIFEHG